MKIALLGCGVVGKQVRTLLDQRDDFDLVRILVKDEKEIDDARMTLDYTTILEDKTIACVIECMGGLEPAHTYVKQALERGCHVITSNKKMLATYYLELHDIAKENNLCLHYEACVCGGIPWIHEIQHVRQVDTISSFYGIMNGTSNYILTKMEEDKSFAEALQEAQQNGYAEMDASDDIDGYDARYKCAISAVCTFDDYVNIEDIPVYGIRNIQKEDMEFAKSRNGIIKLLVQATKEEDFLSLSVMPTLIKKEQTLASIKNEVNAVFMESSSLGESGYIGKGAGGLPTAHAMVQDLFDQRIDKRVIKRVENAKSRKGTFYIRFTDSQFTCPYPYEKQQANAIVIKDQTIKDLEQFTNTHTNIAFVMEVSE